MAVKSQRFSSFSLFFLCEIPAKNICYVLASLGNSERVGIAAIDNGREKIWILLKYRGSIKDAPEGACHSSSSNTSFSL